MASKKRSRATLASVTFDAGLRSALVHLPMALYGPLLERGVPPQSIVVELVRSDSDGAEVVSDESTSTHIDKVYVGWSGMSAAPLTASSGAFSTASNSSATSVVSMSATLATTFSPPLAEGAHVRITLLRSPPLPTAKRIDVVPLTPDDWEILSLNADEVENNMLGQVRAARTGMAIAVHVGRQGRTVCRFRVESCDPPTQSCSPDDGEAGLARAVRLSTDTEVVIAPRSRLSAPVAPPEDEPEEVKFGVAGPSQSAKDVGTPLRAQHYLNHSPFRVLPAHVKPSTLMSAAPVTLHADDANLLSTAFGPTGRCTITKMPCPAAPQVFADAGAQTTAASTRSTTTTDGDGIAATSTGSSVPARATTSTSFGAAIGLQWLPRRQVFVDEALRAKLGLRDFDLVRFSAASPAAAAAATSSRPSSPQGRASELTASTAPALAGYDAVLSSCTSAIENAFRARRWRTLRASLEGQSNGRLSTYNAGLLLTGASGAGKTSVARVVAERLASSSLLIATIHIDCTPFAEERLSAMRALIDQWIAAAIWHSPTVLVLDNLDRIVPADQEHVDSPRNAHVAESLMHRIQQAAAQYDVFVVATAQSNMSINKVCLAHHVFGETVELKAPSKEARRDILAYLVGQRTHLHPVELNFGTLAGQSEGYMPADLRDLVDRTVHQSAVRSMQALQDQQPASTPIQPRHTLTMDDFEQAQKGFTPLSLRDIQLTQSATRWSDIGGLQETRRVLRETLEWPTKYARVFAQCPLRLRSGLLLYGYPGCGKTLLAGAVARECGLNFISVKGPEILNKYIGASEKSVRDLFDRAQAAKPCVLFFDEFDSIAPKRGHDSTGVTDRVVNQLLTQMDGAEGLSGVYVLAATSRPDLIDSALLRPGRLDKSLLCDLPSKEDRLDILNVLCGSNRVRLADDVNLQSWAQRTEGFSGADLQALVYNANLEAIHEGMNARAIKDDDDKKNGTGSSGDASQIRFVRFGGEKASQSTTLSGAERQALQRRMALILGNTNERRDAETSKTTAASVAAAAAAAAAAPAAAMVTEAQLQKCLRTTRQSVPREEQERLRAIYKQFVGDRSGEFPNGEASREVGARQSLM